MENKKRPYFQNSIENRRMRQKSLSMYTHKYMTAQFPNLVQALWWKVWRLI